MKSRTYEVTLFGATGFTGKLIAHRLARQTDNKPLKWAIAGRSKSKLEELVHEFGGVKPGMVIADFHDEETLLKMTNQTRILINVVGPYDLFGDRVIEACLSSGTHYLDITGETAFFHRVYQKYDQQAREKSICIVNAAGFDSIPADFGAWLTAGKLEKNAPILVQAFVKTNARFSSGTWRTAIRAFHQRLIKPGQYTSGSIRKGNKPRLHKSKLTHRWALPMPVLDHHVVRRTAKSLPVDYGKDFRYEHYMSVSTLWKVVRLVVPLGFLALAIRVSAVRKWLESRFPPGHGPDRETRARSFFEIRFFGTNGYDLIETSIRGGDPGYDETSKMVVEAAYEIHAKLISGDLQSGVCTPVQALGKPMVKRLHKIGIEITQSSH